MDKLSIKERSKNMSLIRSKDTKPELIVRKWLFSKGLRYMLHYNIKGKPDIVFPSRKLAVFVNGCFWHSHGCRYSALPATNVDFWKEKILKNKLRDKNNIKILINQGWDVVVVWQCKLITNKLFTRTMNGLFQKICDRIPKNT